MMGTRKILINRAGALVIGEDREVLRVCIRQPRRSGRTGRCGRGALGLVGAIQREPDRHLQRVDTFGR